MPLTQRIMVGPVGIFFTRLLVNAPEIPAVAPNRADRVTMTHMRSVHWRAAATGATIMALMRTTPTVCRPMMMATTSSTVRKLSNRRTGNPRDWQ